MRRAQQIIKQSEGNRKTGITIKIKAKDKAKVQDAADDIGMKLIFTDTDTDTYVEFDAPDNVRDDFFQALENDGVRFKVS